MQAVLGDTNLLGGFSEVRECIMISDKFSSLEWTVISYRAKWDSSVCQMPVQSVDRLYSLPVMSSANEGSGWAQRDCFLVSGPGLAAEGRCSSQGGYQHCRALSWRVFSEAPTVPVH